MSVLDATYLPIADTRSNCIHTEYGTAYIAELDELRDLPQFKAIFSSQRKDHRFLEIIEDTIRQDFEYHYLVLEDDEGTIRGIQPFFVRNQDLLEGASWIRKLVQGLRAIMPRLLTMRTLMVGLTTAEGCLGAAPEDAEWCAKAVLAALDQCAARLGASLAVLKEFPARYRRTLACFVENGYTRIPSMPHTMLELNFRDFDEYMQNVLGKAFRKNLRRKFRDAADAPPVTMQVVSNIAPYVDEVYPLYLQVYQRSKLRFEKLTKEYLCRIGAERPQKAKFFIWRQEGRAVAFSACTVHDEAMWDEYIGLDYGVALDLHLYFTSFRDVINWCCQHGVKRYYSTALSYDPKLHLKCELAPMDLYVKHRSWWLNAIFKRVLKFLQPTRSEPILAKFPNADELE